MSNRILKDKVPHARNHERKCAMPIGMEKKRKAEWDRKPCGCTKTRLSIGKVMVRCERHRGKPSKRILAYWDEGQVRLEP